MAYRFQNDPNVTHQPPTYYANNRLYTGSYARNDWGTRTGRRVHDGFSLVANYGLDTVSDDINSSPYSSPFYINGRYNSQNLSIQRGNSASIQGIKRVVSIGDIEEDFTEEDIQTTVEMWQGKQIKFKLPYTGKIVGNTITLRNTGGCTGILSIYLSTSENAYPIYETAIDLCTVSTDIFEHYKLYGATTVPQFANTRGEIYVRMEIWNEISQERTANPFNTGRKIEIAATGAGNHKACIYTIPDKNTPANNTYDYQPYPSQPLIGFIYNPYQSIPVSRNEDQNTGATVSLNGYEYGIFAYRTPTNARLAIYDYKMEKFVTTTDNEGNESLVEFPIDSRSTQVNIVQGFDYVYYVDGYSVLQRFQIGNWGNYYAFPASKYENVTVSVDTATFASSDLGENSGTYLFFYNQESKSWEYDGETKTLSDYGITISGVPADSGIITVTYTAAGETVEADAAAEYSDARPVIGAGLICKHNNRIYLGKFLNDPNLIQCSQITAEGPDYSSYPYRFYVPDNSPSATSTNTVTAIVTYETDTLLIASKNSFSLFTSNVNLENGVPSQVSTYVDGAGVQSEGDITNYAGIVYSFDPDEGIRRFTGANWGKIPASIDSLVERVDMTKPRKLWGYANRLYFNYTDKNDGKYKCLIWDMDMSYQQYPWFQDYDIPFCDVRFNNDFDILGIHPDYPCVMKLYAHDFWRRLDTPITFERHTKYLSIPGNSADLIVKRVHNKVLANANRWWWFALNADTDTLTQVRGDEAWFRYPCWDTIDLEQSPENPFPYQDEYESDAVATLTISNIRIRGSSIQEKIKVKTFREQASLISTLFEVQPRQYN